MKCSADLACKQKSTIKHSDNRKLIDHFCNRNSAIERSAIVHM